MNNIETKYYESTLPSFLSEHLTNTLTSGDIKLGQLQLRMYSLCQKTLKRLIFLTIFQQQLINLLENIQAILLKDPQNIKMLKNFCKSQIYIWKIKDQIKLRNKLVVDQIKQNQQNSEQVLKLREKEQYEKFSKCVWKIKLELALVNPDQISDMMVQIMREISDSQRIPNNFKQRIKQILILHDFTPINKFMKIISDEISDKSSSNSCLTPIKQFSADFNQSKNLTPQKSLILNSAKTLTQYKQVYLFTPRQKVAQKLRMIEPQKRIMKGRPLNVGRTLFIGHPIRHRAKREQKQKQIIEYVDQHEI